MVGFSPLICRFAFVHSYESLRAKCFRFCSVAGACSDDWSSSSWWMTRGFSSSSSMSSMSSSFVAIGSASGWDSQKILGSAVEFAIVLSSGRTIVIFELFVLVDDMLEDFGCCFATVWTEISRSSTSNGMGSVGWLAAPGDERLIDFSMCSHWARVPEDRHGTLSDRVYGKDHLLTPSRVRRYTYQGIGLNLGLASGRWWELLSFQLADYPSPRILFAPMYRWLSPCLLAAVHVWSRKNMWCCLQRT